MKLTAIALLVAGSVVASNAALAQLSADDVKWINACIVDNKNEGPKMPVIRKYCFCMNEQMDNNENLSITQWEKKNPQVRDRCSRESGWR
jgi:hypothetical protein